jgi:tetratricopeptide (TPR) repeat protein
MGPLWSLGLWAGAAELGHLPSLLSLRRYLLHSKALEELPLFKPAQALFRSHVVAAKDPNVLTLEGESLAIQGKPNAAIRVLTLALEIKGDQGFEWKGHCERLLGESYVKIGQKELGCEYLRAAVSKGYVMAELALAEATDDAEEAMKYTYRTACVNQELFGRVAHLELAGAEGSEKSSKPKREAEKWALEWSRLADPAANY